MNIKFQFACLHLLPLHFNGFKFYLHFANFTVFYLLYKLIMNEMKWNEIFYLFIY